MSEASRRKVADALRQVATRFETRCDSQPSETLDVLNVMGQIDYDSFLRALPLVQDIEAKATSIDDACRWLRAYADAEAPPWTL